MPTTSSSTCPTTPRARDVLAAMGLQPGQCIVALDREYALAGRARARRSGGGADPARERGRRRRSGSSRSPISRSTSRRSPPPCATRARAPSCASRASRARSRRSTTRPTWRWRATKLRGDRRRGGRAPRAVRGRAGAPDRARAAERAVGDRRRVSAPHRGEAFARRPRADRPREGRGADLEGRADARGRAPRGRRAAVVADLTLGEAAKAIGVSADTLRRWDRAGKLRTTRDERNRRLVPPEEVERLSGTPRRHATGQRAERPQPLRRASCARSRSTA